MKYLAIVLFLACGLVTTAIAQDVSVVPEVVSAPPGWTAEGRQIHRGDKLDPGQPLTARDAGELVLRCGDRIGELSYTCSAQTCRVAACSVRSDGLTIHPVGLPARFWDWFTALGSREPVEAKLAAARSGGNTNDAVLMQDARGVHWGPALARVLEGRSCFRLSSLPAGDAGRRYTVVFEWDRSLDRDGVAPVTAAPGLYAFEKGNLVADGSCQADPDATAAWVLVVPSSEFARVNAEWIQRITSAADLERSGASLAVVSMVRHAALADLARPYPPR